MIHRNLKRLCSLLVMTAWMGIAREVPAQQVNYELVPHLQPLHGASLTPEFALADPAGKKVALSDFRGRIVMLNFWASWCVPCREEMPAMERLYSEFRDQGFVVLGVNVRDKREDALAAVKEHKLSYPILFDPSGKWLLAYGSWGLPNTYLIGRKGEGLARMQGHTDWYSAGARELMKTLLTREDK